VIPGDQVERAFREATAGGAGEVELLLAEILLPVDSAADEARVLRDAQGLAASLRGGADFAALARQVSVAASAEEGGDLGWVRPAVILPEIRQKLLALPVGGVSEPIPSPAGVHVFKLRERRAPGGPPEKRLVVTRVDLAQVLVPLAPDAKPPQVKAAEARARELRPSMKGCADVEAYARRTGSEGSGRLGWLDLNDLPPPLRQLVSSLQPRQASEPFRGPLGVQLLMVCDRQGREETVAAAPPPPPPTKDQTRERLEEEQLERLATRYLRELRKDAYIDLRLNA
jgi:peptidyl-prolyl cis-trans isomerase SurA